MSSSKIDFGFIEPYRYEWLSKSKFFPSKVGGRPSFLALKPILGPTELKCNVCNRTMRFILQLYAPIESIENAFHRTLFVFGCGQTKACSEQFVVYRCQLAQKNDFYSDVAPDYDKNKDDTSYDPSPSNFSIQQCPVCNIFAPHRCAQCQTESYCSKEHQVVHWKIGGHKQRCGSSDQTSVDNGKTCKYEGILFPESEIIIDNDVDNEDNNDDKTEDNEEVENELEMTKFYEYIKKNRPTLQDENVEVYVSSGSGNQDKQTNMLQEVDEDEQRTFEHFKKQSKLGEAIRYRADWNIDQFSMDDILWISNKSRLNSDQIPNCDQCGSARHFEFQIMPQLLNHLLGIGKPNVSKPTNEEHLDWGTLLLSETTVFYLLWSVAFRFLIPLAIVWNMDGFWLKYNSFNEMPDVQFKKQLILVLDGYSQMEPNILKQFSYTSFPTMSKAFNLIGQYRPVSIEEYESDYNLDRKLDQLNLKLLIPIDLSTIQIRMESIIHIQSQSWFNAKRIHLDGTLDLIQTNPFHHKGFDFRYNSSLISNSGEYIMIENDSNNKTVEQSFEFEKFLNSTINEIILQNLPNVS
ncbi:hypothetical protein RDWZM_006344 [Blomia tropicalis]|uniref:MYND-type domain-containing protein n=1 Tax=Blomia tropicalis TaxID=40697 RepID=A0A9Q0MAB4_BLOTA|nr:hypothetical protein RDWZM_006344 [Blomia tropicalis]